ncbi:membrane protein insertase YidC [Facklamia miroungae]|uniref:YidC/Oxa1 family membrane protein insertase n=1 Tax=Facklamia miroungae TaxID=120956 RepID=A0A1G7V9C7_9LACT|nr:membrane protein insertase YidC [Facklamia miroungae]NKZ30280.1 membrane protein insertase YidC [Facklamia miroungae]SDG56412.1 YidC/Oxa1 family membrane protein insertase [Facklamia miroungae]
MKFIKKYWKLIFLVSMVSLMATGCIRYDSAGNPTGPIYEYLGVPTAHFLDFLADIFGGSYGIAIIIVTLITRLFMLPSTYKMTKSSMESSAKMKYAQPEISEIQAEMKETDDPEEKAALQQELMQVYGKYDINMLSNVSGCLPLLIQMPIISAVYTAVRSSHKIAEASFLGINLGEKSLLLVVLVAATTFLSSWLMQKGTANPTVDNPQANQMQQSMLYMNPLMLGYFTYISNAGLGLYFFTGSLFNLAQQLYMNQVARPKIQKNIEEKVQKYQNMPREKRQKKARQTKKQLEKVNADRIVPVKTPKARNAGKQKKN